jgi:N-acetylmuramoyl-L-alanine amidase
MKIKRNILVCLCLVAYFLLVPFNTKASASNEDIVQHTIYYPDGDWLYQDVIVSVPQEDSFKNALNMLVKGEGKPDNCYNEFPNNSKVESFEITDNNAIVIFDNSILNKIDNINFSYDVIQDIIAKNVFENYPDIENVILKVDSQEVTSINKDILWNDKQPQKNSNYLSNELNTIIADIESGIMSKEDASRYIQDTIDKELSTSNSIASVSSLSGMKFCIDPGHGGSEWGAVAYRDNITYYEKHFNLVIATSLKSYLEGLGAICYMTRTGDTDVSLTYRYTLANNNNVDVFISTHCNSTTTSIAAGTTVIWPANHDIDISMGIAESVNNIVYSNTPFTFKQPYQDTRGLAVLNGTTMPAIITETGYMSNGTELTYLIPYNNKVAIGTYIGQGVQYFFN